MELSLNYDFRSFKATPVVYAFQLAPTGPIKIGVTQDLQRRYTALQVANPYPLQVLGARTFDQLAEAKNYERDLQSACYSWRIHGEWYRAVDAVLTLLRDLSPLTLRATAGLAGWSDVTEVPQPTVVKRNGRPYVLMSMHKWKELTDCKLREHARRIKRTGDGKLLGAVRR